MFWFKKKENNNLDDLKKRLGSVPINVGDNERIEILAKTLWHYANPEEHPTPSSKRCDADQWWWNDNRGNLARTVLERLGYK